MNEIIIIYIILFSLPISVAIAVLWAMHDMDKQRKEMERENEEYYQKMQSGKEKDEKIQLIKNRWNWMVNERTTTDKSVEQIKTEANIKFKGWRKVE